MANGQLTLEEAFKKFDRATIRAEVEAAEAQRQVVLDRFPLDKWPEMKLAEYAIGQSGDAETFGRLIEFRTNDLGSMRGGSAAKHLIYKHKNKPGWHFDSSYTDEHEAWSAVRDGFVAAFQKAKDGDWDTLDDITALNGGPSLRQKAVHIYFPDETLPVYSKAHQEHFFKRLGKDYEQAWWGVRLNRELLATLRSDDRFKGWSTKEMERFLYFWADPREARRIVKIAPGEDAMYWGDCLKHGYICVGWDEVGDLIEFEDKSALQAEFDSVFAEKHQRQAMRTLKAKELWTLRELEPGDLVIANQGTSKILGIGTVVEPGYEFRPERERYRHTVHVKWDTSVAKSIAPQKKWAFVTVSKVPIDLYQKFVEGKNGDLTTVTMDPFFGDLSAALERKGQIILYGPPGTGKTYSARRFSVWWLLHHAGDKNANAILADHERFRKAERSLSTLQVTRRVWWIVANPKEWSWQQLKKDGSVEYRYGRLQRNYPLVQPGDLVVGYQSTPDKKIVALAKISRAFENVEGKDPSIVVDYLADVTEGLTYDELSNDKLLALSEPMKFRNQGTLFALSADEGTYLLSLMAEREPALTQHVEDEGAVGQLTRLTFHGSYSYEDFIEGFRPVDRGGESLILRLEDGVFKRVCREAQAQPQKKYLILIDEINRANIAKVFGELITLLELDKRGLRITLPQSKESFAIPPNVYLLGTMNTADRSIKLLDSAMRRRFAFMEIMPDVELLHGAKVGGLFLDDFLMGLNQRIAAQVGREKQIGHSYLLDREEPVSDETEFARRFRQEILPLLQEYCYDDYATLAQYIGDKLVDAGRQSLNEDVLGDPGKLLETLAEEFSKTSETES